MQTNDAAVRRVSTEIFSKKADTTVSFTEQQIAQYVQHQSATRELPAVEELNQLSFITEKNQYKIQTFQLLI